MKLLNLNIEVVIVIPM